MSAETDGTADQPQKRTGISARGATFRLTKAFDFYSLPPTSSPRARLTMDTPLGRMSAHASTTMREQCRVTTRSLAKAQIGAARVTGKDVALRLAMQTCFGRLFPDLLRRRFGKRRLSGHPFRVSREKVEQFSGLKNVVQIFISYFSFIIFDCV